MLAGGASDRLPARTTLDVRGERIPPRDLGRSTEAQNWDAEHATTLSDETKARGTSVAAEAGSWLRFSDARLRRPGRITARVASATGGEITVRLDDPAHGRVLGTLAVPASGGPYTWQDVSAPLAEARGVHEVYLTFSAPMEVSRFRLSPR